MFPTKKKEKGKEQQKKLHTPSKKRENKHITAFNPPCYRNFIKQCRSLYSSSTYIRQYSSLNRFRNTRLTMVGQQREREGYNGKNKIENVVSFNFRLGLEIKNVFARSMVVLSGEFRR